MENSEIYGRIAVHFDDNFKGGKIQTKAEECCSYNVSSRLPWIVTCVRLRIRSISIFGNKRIGIDEIAFEMSACYKEKWCKNGLRQK
jgi:hypothetical protein